MNIYSQQAYNRRMTVVVMTVFLAFFAFIGWGTDYYVLRPFAQMDRPTRQMQADTDDDASAPQKPFVPWATIIAVAIALISVGISLKGGTSIVLNSAHARKADPADEKERQFINVVEEVSIAAGFAAPPEAYVIPDPDPNAFAAGIHQKGSVIAATRGLLEKLNREELQGVVAHEMSHIRNSDVMLMTVVAVLAGAIALLSDFAARAMRGSRSGSGRNKGAGALIMLILWLICIILAPLVTRLLAMWISRNREYLADAAGAELIRNPGALASALEKIKMASEPTRSITNGVAHMCIADPKGEKWEQKENFLGDLFATHPPIEKRIVTLKMMAYTQGSH